LGYRYELDLAGGNGVDGCFIGGEINDVGNTVDAEDNVIGCPDPNFDEHYVPQAEQFKDVSYRPS
jgi:hypothetical protein